MQEKSSSEIGEYRKTALDSFINYLWKHDDVIVSVGLGLLIVSLFKVICIISLLQ